LTKGRVFIQIRAIGIHFSTRSSPVVLAPKKHFGIQAVEQSDLLRNGELGTFATAGKAHAAPAVRAALAHFAIVARVLARIHTSKSNCMMKY
jgi:hypothetical protein